MLVLSHTARRRMTGYEWCITKGTQQAYFEADRRLRGFVDVGYEWEPASVEEFFKNHSIDTEQFGKGKAKSIQQLTKELLRGETTFMIDKNTNEVIRYVEIVWCKIFGPTGKLLVEKERVYTNGKKRCVERMPGGKKQPLESVSSAARRILAKELTLPEEMIRLDFSATGNEIDKESVIEDIRVSPSYPGLKSCYTIYIVPAEIVTDEATPELMSEFGLPAETGFASHEVTGDKHVWEWITLEKADEIGALSHDKSLAERAPSQFGRYVPAIENVWEDPQLVRQWLEMYHIDPQNGFEALHKDLQAGTLSLLENSSINQMVCVKDRVSIRAINNGSTLIDTTKNELPTIDRNTHDNVKKAAEKLVEKLNRDNALNLSSRLKVNNEFIFREEAYPAVPSLQMIIRQHIVDVEF